MFRTQHASLIVLFVLASILILSGCGGINGFIDDDGGYDPGDEYYPQYKDLVIALRVVTSGGKPIGGAEVWVDNDLDEKETLAYFFSLDNIYPPQWRGWVANWESDRYQVVINYPGDKDRFEITVTKPGWSSDTTLVSISDYEPDTIFIRDEMVLYRTGSGTSQSQSIEMADVIAGNTQRKPVGGIIIKATDD